MPARRASTPTRTIRTTGIPSETPNTKPPLGKHGLPPTAVTLGNFEMLTKELQRLYGNMRIWVTEYGYQTNPPDKIFGVTPLKQALYMQQAWDKLKANPKVDMMIWFLLRDETRGVAGGWQSGRLHGERRPQALARDVRAARLGQL